MNKKKKVVPSVDPHLSSQFWLQRLIWSGWLYIIINVMQKVKIKFCILYIPDVWFLSIYHNSLDGECCLHWWSSDDVNTIYCTSYMFGWWIYHVCCNNLETVGISHSSKGSEWMVYNKHAITLQSEYHIHHFSSDCVYHVCPNSLNGVYQKHTPLDWMVV